MTSQSKPGPARQANTAKLVIAFLRHSPARHRVLAALVLLPVAAASLVGHIDALRVEALALAAIMTSLLVLSDLAAPRTRASQPDRGVSQTETGVAGPVRPARLRELNTPPGRAAATCILCGAASDASSAKPAMTPSIQDILLQPAGLHMAANDDARSDANRPNPPLDEDRDFWTEEIGLAPRHSPPERPVLPSPATLADAADYSGSFAKQALDMLGACLALLALAPLLAAIWVTLTLAGGGPALVQTRRPAWSDRLFRTTAFATPGSSPGLDTPPLRALVGDYLRRTGLAPLPLLLGVAAGHLSFVGPDPGRRCETIAERAGAAIVAELAERLRARPGLAGSARIHATLSDPALPATHAALVICDLFYLEHATPLLDLRILAGACASFWARPRR